MIAHCVFFEWAEGTTTQQIEGATRALLEMAASIEELKAYWCGPNLRLRPSTADFGVVAFVDDEAGLSTYLDSAAHADVQRTWLNGMIAARTAFQLDIGPEVFSPD